MILDIKIPLASKVLADRAGSGKRSVHYPLGYKSSNSETA